MGWAARLNNARERAKAAGYKKPAPVVSETRAAALRSLVATHQLTRPVARRGGLTITKIQAVD